MQRTLAVLALVVALGSAGALAQDAERLGLAREMLVVNRTADNFDAVVPSVLGALKPAITKGDAKAGRDWDEIAPAIARDMATSKAELLDDIAKIYAAAFTTDELRAVVAFYRSPTGAKLAAQLPALTQQMLAVGQRYGQTVAARVGERMRDELRKRGNTI